MNVTIFEYGGRFGHFLRAEATVNAFSYPIPPRTVLLGLAGAILGLPKDTAQDILSDAQFAVAGPIPQRFWHKANMRKNIPSPLSYVIKKSENGTRKEEKNTRIPQEFLWKPLYRIYAALPPSHHNEFAMRLAERRWHFSPCLGLSELLADLNWIANGEAMPLPDSVQEVTTVVSLDDAELNGPSAHANGLAVQKLRMPRVVTSDRIFSHCNYLLERDGRPIPVTTSHAWQVDAAKVMFL